LGVCLFSSSASYDSQRPQFIENIYQINDHARPLAGIGHHSNMFEDKQQIGRIFLPVADRFCMPSADNPYSLTGLIK